MTNIDFSRNFEWQNRYLAKVTSILQAHIQHLVKIEIASVDLDTKESTDMVLSIASGGAIAVRLRRHNVWQRDLTIRCKSHGGGKTEIHKLSEGFADWYFYGWLDKQDNIYEWVLADISKMRSLGLISETKWRVIHNRNDNTAFIAIPANKLWASGCIVVAQSARNGLMTAV